MKKIILLVLSFTFLSTVVFGASLNLKAMWTANTEIDMMSYRLYRTDGMRTLIGTIPHPTTQYLFTLTIPDASEGTLKFVLTAVDTASNESLDSGVVTYPFDLKAPLAPGGLGVVKQ